MLFYFNGFKIGDVDFLNSKLITNNKNEFLFVKSSIKAISTITII